MKKLLLVCLLCLIPYLSFASGPQVLATGTCIRDNMRLSTIAGTAFWQCNGVDISAFAGEYIELRDTANKVLRGFAKAAGGGLAYGSDKDVDGITKANPGVVTLAASSAITDGMCVYFSGLTEMTDLNTKYRTVKGTSGDTFQLESTSGYAAAETTGGNCLKQLTVPAATGVTIVSTNGGTTYNWAFTESGFNVNDSSYTYRILSSNIPGSTPSLKGTATGTTQLRISLVDGTAFIDGDGTIPVSAYVGHTLKIRDSSGYEIVGVIKAVGSGETTGTQIFSNWDFSSAEPPGTAWTRAGWVVSDGVASVVSGGTTRLLTQLVNPTQYALYLWSMDINSISGSIVFWAESGILSESFTTTGTKTWYRNRATSFGTHGVRAAISTTVEIDNLSFTKVLTPSATGATIVSATGGTTYNWTSKHASFNPNSATFTWEIVPVSQGTITSSNVKLATVDGGAMVEITGVDLSPYAGDDAGGPVTIINPKSTSAATMTTNKYLLALYDSSGRVATGYVGAAGGGETLGAEIATGTLTAGKLYKITATEANHFYTGCAIGEYFTSVGTETCDANNKVQEVTEIAATGVHGHSTANATDRKMSLKTTGFDPNAVTSYKIYRVY